MAHRIAWLVPLTGLVFLALAIVAFAIGGDVPDPTEESAEEIAAFYADNEGTQITSAVLATVAGTLLAFFGGYLRMVLRAAEGANGVLSAMALAGAIILAIGLAIDGTITFTLVEAADDIDPAAVQALSALYNNDFLPLALGAQVFLFATGISIARHGALPKWLGWVAIVLAVVAVTPIGFVSFIGAGVLVAVFSVVLSLRARKTGGQPA